MLKRIISAVTALALTAGAWTYTASVPYSTVPLTASAAMGNYDNLMYNKYSDHIEIYRGNNDIEELVIPAEIDGLPVTSIGSVAFKNCSNITSIKIPDSVTDIKNNAFENCSSLTSITIPDSVTIIDSDTFIGCSNLTSITIPDSVTIIRSGAFTNCSALESITIPDGVTTIERGIFKRCTALTSIALPDSITSIAYGAFDQCESLESITFPDSVETIGGYAFSGCSSLTSITIPDNVTDMGEYVFSGCTGLISVTIPESFTSIANGLFSDCTSLKELALPESVTNIGKKAFSGSGLTELKIPEGCEYISIGDYAFEKTNISNVTINCSSDIGKNAFSECDSLVTAELYNSHVSSRAFSDCSSLKELKFSGTTVLGTQSVSNCPVLENIDFTECELTSDYAFSYCPMLFNIDKLPVFDSETEDFIPQKKDFIFEYFNGADDVGFINQYVLSQTDKVVKEYITEDMSDMQKVLALHDWVCENTKFTEGNTKDRENHSDASVFMNEYTVCEGYARACNLLFHAAGIETYYVQSSSHAWNIVNIGGHYFHVDSTWDDGEPISRSWFLKSDEEMSRETVSHGVWELFVPSSLHSFQEDIMPKCEYKMGDVNFDGSVDASDASDVLKAYADLSTNQTTDIDHILADHNFDGIIDAKDASDILAVYAYNSTH